MIETKIKVIKAPGPLPVHRVNGVIPKSMFLAGSIEMGNAEDWQTRFTEALKYQCKVNTVLNPRRDDWDSSWEQHKGNAQFHEQVSWEMTALDVAEYIFMYFDPNTKSPISLLELGMYSHTGKLIVCCPPKFWRKGNVDIVCERFGIRQTYDMETTIRWLRNGVFWK